MPRFDASEGLWKSFENHLAETLLEMSEGDFYILSGQSDDEFIQFLRKSASQGLIGECSGPQSLGGPSPWSPSQQREIESLGWGPVDDLAEYPNYRVVWLPEDQSRRALSRLDAHDAATLARRTLEGVLRIRDPRDLNEQQDSMEDHSSSAVASGELTGTERRVLMEALDHHQKNKVGQAAEGWKRGGFSNMLMAASGFAEAAFLDPHVTLRDHLLSTGSPRFDAKTRMLLLEAVDQYARSGVARPHPSPLSLNPHPENRDLILRALRHVAQVAR